MDNYKIDNYTINRYKLVKRFLPFGREIRKEQVLEVIMSLPNAQKQGEWLNDGHDMPRCSECGYIPEFNENIDDYYYSDYCPNCGADMRKDGEDE